MLHPTMPLSDLQTWAIENQVEYALSYPAKMLLVPTSKIHTNWLWVCQQNNTPIEEIITRPTAYTLQESSPETAPLEFQQAAIEYLEQMVANAKQAQADELELLDRSAPTNPILKQIWQRALTQRATIRQKVSPRSKKDRRTQKLWLDAKKQVLQYKEENIAWCGGGSWTELYIHLDTGRQMLSCKCLNGKNGQCRLGLSAIDQTIEMLTDPSKHHLHERLIKTIGTPKWKRDFQQLDAALEVKDHKRPGESLGWRIKETKQGLSIEAVWCIHKSSGWKHRQAVINEALEVPEVWQHPADYDLLQLLSIKDNSTWSTVLNLLREHPRVFIGSRTNTTGILELSNPSLYFAKNETGVEWSIMVNKEEVLPLDLLNPQSSTKNIWYKLEEDRFTYSILHNKLQVFIDKLSNISKILPSAAILALYQRLPQIEEIIPIHLDKTLRGSEHQPDSRPIIRVTVSASNSLRLELVVRPDNNKTLPIASGNKVLYKFNQKNQEFGFCSRNFASESAYRDQIRETLQLDHKENNQWTITGSDQIFSILATLQQLPTDQINRIEWLSSKPQIQMLALEDLQIDVFNSAAGLEIKGALNSDEEELSLWEVLPAIRENNPYLLVKGHVWYTIQSDFRARLRTLADVIQPTKTHLHVNPSHALTLHNILSSETIEAPLVVKECLRSIQNVYMTDKPFAYTLRPYQTTGVEWMLGLHQWASGCVLADEMGLGKTVQVISFLHQIQSLDQNKVLIIAPKSTSGNWLNTLQECLTDWTIMHYQGSSRTELIHSFLPKQCLVMTYDVMVRDIEHLLQYEYTSIIFDEAQYLKNPQSSRFQAAILLKSAFYIALTGTPIENSILDLWSIFQVVLPNHLGSWAQFKVRFISPIESGNTYRLTDLKKLIHPFLLRRKKEEVAQDLPEKIEINERITLSTFERDTYEQLKIQAKQIIKDNPQQAKFLVLSLLTKLRQVCCHRGLIVDSASNYSSKLNRALEIIQNLSNEGKKILVFSQFVRLLQIFKKMLEQENIELCYLDGGTSSAKRQSEIDRFQESDVSVFLISLKAGGSGINLTSATEVIHLDPWWNPAVEDQASDRAHRIGQTQTVTVIRLVADDTIETQILKLQSEKRKIAEDLLTDSISKLSLAEIEDLLD